MNSELARCPFCGSPAIKRWAMIHCSVCPAMMQDEHADETAHVEAWNRRAALSGEGFVCVLDDTELDRMVSAWFESCKDEPGTEEVFRKRMRAALAAAEGAPPRSTR